MAFLKWKEWDFVISVFKVRTMKTAFDTRIANVNGDDGYVFEEIQPYKYIKIQNLWCQDDILKTTQFCRINVCRYTF